MKSQKLDSDDSLSSERDDEKGGEGDTSRRLLPQSQSRTSKRAKRRRTRNKHCVDCGE